MLELFERFKQAFPNEVYDKYVKQVFKYTLKKDQNKKDKFKGYPNADARRMDVLSYKTGIKFVDTKKRDFTLEPLMKQYSYYLGGEKSLLYKVLRKLNMRLFGGIINLTRYENQIKFLESYREYANTFAIMTVVENLMDKDNCMYILKILEDFRENIDKHGMNLKSFIKKNSDYFEEIEVFFDFKDKSELDCLDDSLEELKARKEATKRDYLMKGSIANGLFDMIVLTLVFGKQIIPEITEQFNANINDFSTPVIVMNAFYNFLINRWYLAVVVGILLYLFFKSKLLKLTIGYLSLKIPVIRDYVINDQLLRFLKSYMNLIRFDTVRNAYVQSLKMVNNEYFKFILSSYVEEGKQDIGDTGVTFYKVIDDIPYIPKEYMDIIKESEVMGKPENGIEKTINLMEPRVEMLVDKAYKYMMFGTFLISSLIGVYLFLTIFQDMNRIIEIDNQRFIDNLRN